MVPLIRILFIEDSTNDCEVLLAHLRDNGYTPEAFRVETEAEMRAIATDAKIDVILCDLNLLQFEVYIALRIAKENFPHVPFIIVSGTMTEDLAVRVLKAGANDYVLKDKLSRLIPAIERELLDASSKALHLKMQEELKAREDELRQSHKLEAVGQLAGGIAHDFNNILAVILIQAEVSLDFLDGDPERRKHNENLYQSFDQIKNVALRAANLTRQLLAFSRKQVIQPQVIDLNESVRQMAEMLGRVIEENIKLELELDKQIKNIKVDPGHFEQIIMNLVVNSRDAMPEGGKLTMKTENSSIDETVASKTRTIPGPYTLLEISDSGSGMSEETQRKIFDPFFTTKPVGKGTGLGLSTVYGIVKQNKGLIFVESAIGMGTKFRIFFPQTDEKVKVSAIMNTEMNKLRGSETVLVAEDQSELRDLVCETLKSSGYNVIQAKDGIEAFNLIASNKVKIDLVLTDVVMPHMGGHELSQKAKSVESKAKFLFLSGYTEDVLMQQGITSGQTYFMEKPFAMKSLLSKVRHILDSR